MGGDCRTVRPCQGQTARTGRPIAGARAIFGKARRAGRIRSGPSWFLLGLFSLLDALLDRKIEFALQQIKLAQPVEEALLGTAPSEDRMVTVYALVRGYESGDWDVVTALAEKIQMSASDVGAAYVESARWAAEVFGLAV